MRLTVPHYYDFGESPASGALDSAEAWDEVRMQEGSPFALASDRAGLAEMLASRPEVAGRAEAISALATGSVASYGVGGGLLEAGLDVERLALGEYAPATVERLSALFPAAEVVRHDLRVDGPLDAELHLFHRIDTEFTTREWRRIFRTFGDQRILFVPGGVETPFRMALHLVSAMRRQRQTRVGLMRTTAAIRALWTGTHGDQRIWLHDTEAWDLTPL